MAGIEKEPGQTDKQIQNSEPAEEIIDEDDEMIMDGIVEVDESSVAANSDQAATRRRLEDYLEEKRLRKELGDDPFDGFT